MTTPPFLTMPDICAASVVMTAITKNGITESPFTGEEQQFNWNYFRWSISTPFPPIKDPNIAREFIAFGLALKGTFGRFLYGDPSFKTPRGSVTGPALVNGNNQTGNTLVVDGLTPNTVNILRKGDYLQIGTGLQSRLHMMTEDIDSDAGGNAVLAFEPQLRYSPLDNSQVIFENAKGVFRCPDNTFSWSVVQGKFYNINFEALEVVNA